VIPENRLVKQKLKVVVVVVVGGGGGAAAAAAAVLPVVENDIRQPESLARHS